MKIAHQKFNMVIKRMSFCSLEKKRENIILESTAQSYGKRRVTKTQNITELPLKQTTAK